MSFNLKKGDVVTVWVNQVMYPGVVTFADSYLVELDSVQYEGLKYKVRTDSITALTIDSNADTMEKLNAQKKAFEEKQRAAAEAMREEANQLASGAD